MEAGVQALKERGALASRLIELATACPSMDLNVPITPSDGRLLLCAAFAGELKNRVSALWLDPHEGKPRGTAFR